MSFPPKPNRLEDFDKPVSWLAGRDLLAGLKWIVLYSAFKGKLDPRDWMKASVFPRRDDVETAAEWWRRQDDANWKWKVDNDKFWQQQRQERGDFWKDDQQKEFWFDYIADSGDGQAAVYNVAYLCLSDLWTVSHSTIGSPVRVTPQSGDLPLPRGQFLFVGGDTAYHIADYTSLSERFQIPFRWAFASVRRWLSTTSNRMTADIDQAGRILDESADKTDSEPDRPIFGIPGNHDYYDFLDGFNRQFRRPALEEHGLKADHPQLSILGFERCQNASYAALELPFGWWFWALDTEVSKLDARQQCFFLDLLDPDRGWLAADDKAKEKAIPKKLILATPEPTTVFRKRIPDSDKTIEAYEQLGLKQPFKEKPGEPGRCRLDLSGDVHHYARYYGPNTKNLPDKPFRSSNHYASVVAGGGGAFLHPSETHWTGSDPKPIEEQVLYPLGEVSHAEFSGPLFDLRNIFNGGYVWLFGMIVTGVIYFALTIPQTSKNFLEWVLLKCDENGNCEGRILGRTTPFMKDGPLRGLPELNFQGGIDLKGYVAATVSLVVAVAILGIGIFLFYRFVKQLTSAPSIGLSKAAQRLPTTYRDLWPVGLCLLLALGSYGIGVATCIANRTKLHPFGLSLIILVHIVVGVELLILSVQNSAWLAHRPKLDTGHKSRFAPVWALTGAAGGIVLFGIWAFGSSPGAYVLSDVTFALVVIGLFVALTVLGGVKGGELQRLPGKLFMTLMGMWHAILQLVVALALIRIGNWRAVIVALGLILLFSGLSIPYTKISIDGLGARAMRGSPVILIVLWFTYGAALLALPVIFHEHRGSLMVGKDHYSSFLPPAIVNLFGQNVTSYGPAWVLEIISLLSALGLGFLLSMSFLSWYFAVAMVFQGHNNEVGGAGRIEKFRHILRICLTEDSVTCYVIAFDEPKVDGHDLDLELVDKFTLTVT
jgi:hypothetical protein